MNLHVALTVGSEPNLVTFCGFLPIICNLSDENEPTKLGLGPKVSWGKFGSEGGVGLLVKVRNQMRHI